MSDDLVQALRDSKGWPTLGHAAADRIEELEAELAYYRGFHDGICSTGTHVVVERTQMSDDELLRWADRQHIDDPVPPDALDKIKALSARIREQRELLEECEQAMREVERLVLGANHSQTRYAYFLATLAKLSA